MYTTNHKRGGGGIQYFSKKTEGKTYTHSRGVC